MRLFSLLFYMILIFVGIVFAVLNAELVKVDLYFGVYNLPLSLLALCLFGLGICIGLSSGFITSIKMKFENRKLAKSLDLAKQELSKLRLLSAQE